MQSFIDPSQTIQVSVGQRFSVELPGNPTTGYLWHPHVEGQHLERIGDEYRPGGNAIGAGGREIHRFRALKAGKTEILLEYRRPWDNESRDSRRFRVEIT